MSRLQKLNILCLSVLLFVAPPLAAQDTKSPNGKTTNVETPTPPAVPPAPPALKVPKGFNSPRSTMFTFLEAINAVAVAKDSKQWKTVNQCLDLSKVSRDLVEERAEDLLGILNRLGYIESWHLPGADEIGDETSFTYFPDTQFHDLVSGIEVEGKIELALITEGDEKGYWKFSAETMAGIHDLFLALEDLPIIAGEAEAESLTTSGWLRSKMPASLRGGNVLTLEYWQWVAIFLLIGLGVVVDHLVRLILRLITGRIITRKEASASKEAISAVVRPLGLLSAGLLWMGLMHVLGLPNEATTILFAAVRVFTILAGTWAAWRLADLIGEVLASKAAKTETKFDDVLIPLVRKAIKLFIIAFGLIYMAVSLNINILPMLTGLGIGGLAFAFAAKDTIENFFGSIAVIADRAFEVGDWVVIDDVEGTVESVGFRSTRIRTFYNSLMVVPNATLVRATVDNYGQRKYRRWKTYLGVQYDTPPDKIIAFTEGVREIVRSHPYTRKDYFQVYLNQFSGSSLDILLYVFWETPDWSTELRERERMALDIIRLADQLGVEFAFPTQTIHMYKEEHAAQHNPGDVPESLTDRRSAVSGIRAAQQIMGNQSWQKIAPGAVKFRKGPTDLSVDGEPAGDADDEDETFIEDRTAGS